MNKFQFQRIIHTLIPEFTDIKIVSSKYFRTCYLYVVYFKNKDIDYLLRLDYSYDYVQILTDVSDNGKILAEVKLSESPLIRKILDE